MMAFWSTHLGGCLSWLLGARTVAPKVAQPLVAISLCRNKKCCGRWGSSRPFLRNKAIFRRSFSGNTREVHVCGNGRRTLPSVHQVAWRVLELLDALVSAPALRRT